MNILIHFTKYETFKEKYNKYQLKTINNLNKIQIPSTLSTNRQTKHLLP